MRTLLLSLLVLGPLAAFAQRTSPRPLQRATVSPPPAPATLPQQYAAVSGLRHADEDVKRTSGTRSDQNTRMRVPNGGWITGIEMGERGDRPCFVQLRWSTIIDGVMESALEERGCTPTASSRQYIGFTHYNSPPQGADADRDMRALTGLRVCQRNSNDRVKGLAVRSAYLTSLAPEYVSTEAVTNSEQGTRSFSRPNCNDWESYYESCPAGRVMVGVEISQRSQDAVITGLAPICARLRVLN